MARLFAVFAGDGLLIGYLVTENFEQAKAGMRRLEVNERWQGEMAVFFEGLEAHARAAEVRG